MLDSYLTAVSLQGHLCVIVFNTIPEEEPTAAPSVNLHLIQFSLFRKASLWGKYKCTDKL